MTLKKLGDLSEKMALVPSSLVQVFKWERCHVLANNGAGNESGNVVLVCTFDMAVGSGTTRHQS